MCVRRCMLIRKIKCLLTRLAPPRTATAMRPRMPTFFLCLGEREKETRWRSVWRRGSAEIKNYKMIMKIIEFSARASDSVALIRWMSTKLIPVSTWHVSFPMLGRSLRRIPKICQKVPLWVLIKNRLLLIYARAFAFKHFSSDAQRLGWHSITVNCEGVESLRKLVILINYQRPPIVMILSDVRKGRAAWNVSRHQQGTGGRMRCDYVDCEADQRQFCKFFLMFLNVLLTETSHQISSNL